MSNWPLMAAIRSGVVPSPAVDFVDVGAAVEQRARRLEVALPRGMVQRRQAALRADRRVDLFRIEVAVAGVGRSRPRGSGGGILPDSNSSRAAWTAA